MIKEFFYKGNQRTTEAKKNIILSFGNRGLSILINLLLVPLTINYINATQYGIWLTISSIIQWLSFFDFGFAHGFRNKFAEAKAKNDIILARKYVSTTYAVLTIIFGLLFLVSIIINYFLDWSQILQISATYKSELSKIVFILVLFLCVQLVGNVFSVLLMADQKPALSSFILTLSQLLTLTVIFIMTKVSSGSLYHLSLVSASIPALVVIIISIFYYKTKYKELSPSFKYIDIGLSRNILGLGGKFFLIQLSMLFVLQLSNIILSRYQGPMAVTEYNIAYKYFSVLYMMFVIIFTPFWSAFTDAFTKNEYEWMRVTYKRLFKIALLSIPAVVLLLIISPVVYKLWIGNSNVKISFLLSSLMSLYIVSLVFGNLCMSLINGTGKILLQTIIYIFFAIVSIPLMIFFCKSWGVAGVTIVPIIVFLIQNIFGYIQLNKILKNKAAGVWFA